MKKVNARWLVNGGLDRDAENYIQHLEAVDLPRLERSCRIARRLVDIRDRSEDPKPWFYAGLFSLATTAEAERFAGRHPLTLAAISPVPHPGEANRSPATLGIILRIREALARVRQDAAED